MEAFSSLGGAGQQRPKALGGVRDLLQFQERCQLGPDQTFVEPTMLTQRDARNGLYVA